MSDLDLRTALSALRAPAPSEAVSARALHRATIALAANCSTPAPRHRFTLSTSFLRTFGSVAAACLLLALGIWSTRPSLAPNTDQALAAPFASREFLAELQALFPGQLNALIDRDGTLSLDLADASSLPPASADQAVIIELNRAGLRLRVLAYSGRAVRLDLGGVTLGLDPLITSDGDILLAGDNFVWSSAHPTASAALPGWHIAARPLGLPL